MRKLFKWIGIILGVLIGLLIIAYAVIYIRSEALMNKHYAVQKPSITILTDEAALTRGKHLVENASVCIECHGQNLGGGIVVVHSSYTA